MTYNDSECKQNGSGGDSPSRLVSQQKGTQMCDHVEDRGSHRVVGGKRVVSETTSSDDNNRTNEVKRVRFSANNSTSRGDGGTPEHSQRSGVDAARYQGHECQNHEKEGRRKIVEYKDLSDMWDTSNKQADQPISIGKADARNDQTYQPFVRSLAWLQEANKDRPVNVEKVRAEMEKVLPAFMREVGAKSMEEYVKLAQHRVDLNVEKDANTGTIFLSLRKTLELWPKQREEEVNHANASLMQRHSSPSKSIVRKQIPDDWLLKTIQPTEEDEQTAIDHTVYDWQRPLNDYAIRGPEVRAVDVEFVVDILQRRGLKRTPKSCSRYLPITVLGTYITTEDRNRMKDIGHPLLRSFLLKASGIVNIWITTSKTAREVVWLADIRRPFRYKSHSFNFWARVPNPDNEQGAHHVSRPPPRPSYGDRPAEGETSRTQSTGGSQLSTNASAITVPPPSMTGANATQVQDRCARKNGKSSATQQSDNERCKRGSDTLEPKPPQNLPTSPTALVSSHPTKDAEDSPIPESGDGEGMKEQLDRLRTIASGAFRAEAKPLPQVEMFLNDIEQQIREGSVVVKSESPSERSTLSDEQPASLATSSLSYSPTE